jgi:hypothetical protein
MNSIAAATVAISTKASPRTQVSSSSLAGVAVISAAHCRCHQYPMRQNEDVITAAAYPFMRRHDRQMIEMVYVGDVFGENVCTSGCGHLRYQPRAVCGCTSRNMLFSFTGLTSCGPNGFVSGFGAIASGALVAWAVKPSGRDRLPATSIERKQPRGPAMYRPQSASKAIKWTMPDTVDGTNS